MPKFKAGQTIRFTYNHTRLDEASGDRFKEIFVLHPGWLGKVHGIDLKRLTAAEREVINAVFDPRTKEKPHRLPLVNDILRRMDPIQEVKNPQTFYHKFVKVFLRNKDAYRTYEPVRMLNASVVRQSTVPGNVINPKPLFHKVESKKEPETLHGKAKTAKTDPMLLQRVAQQMGVKVSPKAGQQTQDRLAQLKASMARNKK